MEKYFVVLFETATHAMQFEKVMRMNGVAIKLIPSPREITVCCCLAGKILIEDIDRVLLIQSDKELKHIGVYEVTMVEGEKKYRKVTQE